MKKELIERLVKLKIKLDEMNTLCGTEVSLEKCIVMDEVLEILFNNQNRKIFDEVYKKEIEEYKKKLSECDNDVCMALEEHFNE